MNDESKNSDYLPLIKNIFFTNETAVPIFSRVRYIESNIGKSARHPRVRFPCLAFFEGLWFYFLFFPLFFLTLLCSCVLFDSYALLADDHVCNVSYFPFMSIKKIVPYFCVLREGYYVIIYNYGLHEKLISIIIKCRKDRGKIILSQFNNYGY